MVSQVSVYKNSPNKTNERSFPPALFGESLISTQFIRLCQAEKSSTTLEIKCTILKKIFKKICLMQQYVLTSLLLLLLLIINPLTARVVGAPQMTLQPVFSIFPCSPLPSGTCRTPGLSIPWCCLPTSSFVRLLLKKKLLIDFVQAGALKSVNKGN